MADKDKLKALDLAVNQIEKQFGKGSIMRLGKEEVPAGIAAISTGSPIRFMGVIVSVIRPSSRTESGSSLET